MSKKKERNKVIENLRKKMNEVGIIIDDSDQVYEITDITKILTLDCRIVKLHRIRALKSFCVRGFNIEEGDLGGWIEKESNLVQSTICWVGPDAMVYDNAVVTNIRKEMRSNNYYYGNMQEYVLSIGTYVGGKSYIGDNAVVTNGHIHSSNIGGDSEVSGYIGMSNIKGSVTIRDKGAHDISILSSNIKGHVHIEGLDISIDHCTLSDNTAVYGNHIRVQLCILEGKSFVTCDDRLFHIARCNFDTRVDKESFTKEKKIEQLISQCNLVPEPGDETVIAYKYINYDCSSWMSEDFKYDLTPGAVITVDDYEEDPNIGCANGLHFSNPTYFEHDVMLERCTMLLVTARINIDDIIAIKSGKIRCRKATILTSRMMGNDKVVVEDINGKKICRLPGKVKEAIIPEDIEVFATVNTPVSYFRLPVEFCPESIRFPENSKCRVIKKFAFEDLAIHNIVLPESLEEIQDMAFCNCSVLREIRIPKGVKQIRNKCFRACWKLEKIILEDPDNIKIISVDLTSISFKQVKFYNDEGMDITDKIDIINVEE